jgi:hypothetical protein
MPSYTAEFHTDAGWAMLEIKAPTPQEALTKACAVEHHTLDFQPYDDWQPVNYITIRDADHNDLAEWQDNQLRLEKTAAGLLNALKDTRQFLAICFPNLRWEQIDAVIAKAEGGVP